MTEPQKPSVGRIVHVHVRDRSRDRLFPPVAAIITQVNDDDTVELTAFVPWGSPEARHDVPFSDEPKDGCWNWPPRA